MDALFKETVRSEEELHALCGFPNEIVNHKTISRIDRHCRDFISRSPIVFVATSDASGCCDVSPRGDQAGFVHVIDDKHLLIPERPGNRRFDTLKNLLQNPGIGLIFLIPGLEETLRINGWACIVKDPELLEPLEAFGKRPVLGIGVEAEECYIHCAKALKRSHLWEPPTWPEKESLPKPAAIIADHAKKLGKTESQVAAAMQESYEKRLY
ncbi:pyridoxamine 5'-phosphate oxidase family protein [Paenibacillus silviterrae]|uniref:pyridoxamine 5'-phosphate oxidase family protein n=1 Tax=Paenibacillus silviterrae TaxID=3242194 RepID=UPI002543CCAD|nr:pyridoxamine 5'-phosphate oxidase family protein [Paenibacillus chinjuensis]